MSSTHYFAIDGNYGDAESIVIVDTSTWDEDDWAAIEYAPEGRRAEIARAIADGEYNENQLELPLDERSLDLAWDF